MNEGVFDFVLGEVERGLEALERVDCLDHDHFEVLLALVAVRAVMRGERKRSQEVER